MSLGGEVLADSARPTELFESNLPVRWSLPPDDVHAHPVPSDTVTVCGYKGRTSHHNVKLADGDGVQELVWYFQQPLTESIAVKALLCFFD